MTSGYNRKAGNERVRCKKRFYGGDTKKMMELTMKLTIHHHVRLMNLL